MGHGQLTPHDLMFRNLEDLVGEILFMRCVFHHQNAQTAGEVGAAALSFLLQPLTISCYRPAQGHIPVVENPDVHNYKLILCLLSYVVVKERHGEQNTKSIVMS